MARTEVRSGQLRDAAGVDLVADVFGVLPPGNGGTGLSSSGADGNALFSDGTKWVSRAIAEATSISSGLMTARDFRKVAKTVDVVEDFGADPTGATNSATAFQNAANSLGVGGTVTIPKGRYLINTTVTATNTHVRWIGAGRADTILFTTDPTITMFSHGSGAWFSGFVDLSFDNTDPNNPSQAIVTRTGTNFAVDLGSSPYAYMRNVDMMRHKNTLRAAGHLAEFERINIREFAQYGGVGILLEGDANANDKFLSNITMASSLPYASGSACIRVKQGASLRLANLNLVGAENTLDLFPDTGQVIPSIYAVNSFFDQASQACLRVRGNGAVQRSKFVQCWFSGIANGNTQYGVFLDGASGTSLVVNGMDFIGCDIYGNLIGFEAVPAGASKMDWQVTDSRVSGNSTVGIRTTAGSNHDFSVISNHLGQSGGFGANGLAMNVQAGTYRSYQIISNRGLQDNTTKGIIDSGSTTEPYNKNVKDNVGGLMQGGAASRTTPIAATTAETIILQTRIPANSIVPGTQIRVRAFGWAGAVALTTNASTATWRVRVGTTGTTADTQVVLLGGGNAGNNAPVNLEANLNFRTIGTSAEIMKSAVNIYGGSIMQLNNATTFTVNTTADFIISVTCLATQSGSNINVEQAFIEIVK